MIYFPSRDLLFIHVPRTAGSSLLNALINAGEKITLIAPPHTPWCFLQPDVQERLFTAYKVAFVRNSWERVLSWFSLLCDINQLEMTKEGFDNWLRDNCPTNGAAHPDINKFSFSQLVHFPSVDKMDFIGQFESLNEDVGGLEDILGIDLRLDRMNSSLVEDHRSFYDFSSIEMIRTACKKEIDFFNFSYI